MKAPTIIPNTHDIVVLEMWLDDEEYVDEHAIVAWRLVPANEGHFVEHITADPSVGGGRALNSDWCLYDRRTGRCWKEDAWAVPTRERAVDLMRRDILEGMPGWRSVSDMKAEQAALGAAL
jgi:hypothetical protein